MNSYQNNELINLLIPEESEVLSALPEKPVNNNLNLLFSHGSAQCWQSISHLLENNQLPHNTWEQWQRHGVRWQTTALMPPEQVIKSRLQ